MTEKHAPYHFNTWRYKFLSGTTIGLINATVVTPVVNYNNHVINQSVHAGHEKHQFTLVRAFDGVISYNVSFILRISVSLSLNSFFMHQLNRSVEVTDSVKVLSSIVSGGIAGSVATLPEAIAQTQQLSTNKPSPMAIVKDAYKSNGLFGLTRGMQAMMARSACFTAGYLGLMPLFSQRMRQEFGDHRMADVFSAMVCGFMVGVITTPPNTLRFKMQENFTKQGPAPTYTKLLQEAYASNQGLRSLFVGLKPRTIMSMCSMFIIAEGNKLCNLYATDGFPDFPSLTFK